MEISTLEQPMQEGMGRRRFLRYAGTGAAMAAGVLAVSACHKDSNSNEIRLGDGDTRILNYAYALEQLEAAFYTQVVQSPYANISDAEKSILTDIRDHEVAHRDFFKAALGSSAIQNLSPNFSMINFNDRTSVLSAARSFEDLGVAAYNGAGALIQKSDYLVIAGKIVSVEARHAALIRDLIAFNSFVDNSVVDIMNTSLERSKTPLEVIPVANQFLTGRTISTYGF